MLFSYFLHAYNMVTFSEVCLNSYVSNGYIQFLTPAHKGWGYSRPLRRPGGRHKACGCYTA